MGNKQFHAVELARQVLTVWIGHHHYAPVIVHALARYQVQIKLVLSVSQHVVGFYTVQNPANLWYFTQHSIDINLSNDTAMSLCYIS